MNKAVLMCLSVYIVFTAQQGMAQMCSPLFVQILTVDDALEKVVSKEYVQAHGPNFELELRAWAKKIVQNKFTDKDLIPIEMLEFLKVIVNLPSPSLLINQRLKNVAKEGPLSAENALLKQKNIYTLHVHLYDIRILIIDNKSRVENLLNSPSIELSGQTYISPGNQLSLINVKKHMDNVSFENYPSKLKDYEHLNLNERHPHTVLVGTQAKIFIPKSNRSEAQIMDAKFEGLLGYPHNFYLFSTKKTEGYLVVPPSLNNLRVDVYLKQ